MFFLYNQVKIWHLPSDFHLPRGIWSNMSGVDFTSPEGKNQMIQWTNFSRGTQNSEHLHISREPKIGLYNCPIPFHCISLETNQSCEKMSSYLARSSHTKLTNPQCFAWKIFGLRGFCRDWSAFKPRLALGCCCGGFEKLWKDEGRLLKSTGSIPS